MASIIQGYKNDFFIFYAQKIINPILVFML
jgi:hypothetical protein